MRKSASNDRLSVRVIAGTHVVLLAIDVHDDARAGLLGFAIGRKLADGNVDWLEGTKVFEPIVPNPEPGVPFPTNKHPVQSLMWSDYAASPATQYDYAVAAVYGPLAQPELRHQLDISVTTEDPTTGKHGIFFNRGAIASQGFSAKFHNKVPTDIDNPNDPEVIWLSRGLLEAALAFIAQAGKGDALYVAAYEFTYAPIFKALIEAAKRGAKVKIVHEAGKERNDKTGKLEETSATKAAARAIIKFDLDKQKNVTLIKRTKRDNIPHNKFIVFAPGDVPKSVWTGSTNLTPSGFLGQTNVGHLVRDETVAAKYRAYWNELSKDPTSNSLAEWSEAFTKQTDLDANLATDKIVTYFSPRRSDEMLLWYADKMAEATQTVMFTAPFGVNKWLAAEFGRPKPFTRFILLEDPLTPAVIEKVKNDPNVLAAAGSLLGASMSPTHPIPASQLDRWFLKEDHFRHQGNVFFIHTKILMVDPLSDDPRIFTGSANFSTNSLEHNDENMLLIRGETAVADIYVTEFDRIFRHFFARQEINRRLLAHQDVHEAKFLKTDASWLTPFVQPANFKCKRHRLFFPHWPNQ